MVFRVFLVFFAAASVFAVALGSFSPARADAPVQDARFGWEFPFSVVLPKPSGEARVTVHYQTVGDAPIAEQAARLFTRLMRLHKAHFGLDTAFYHDAENADVWLAGQRPVAANDGGETRQNQMYLFGIHDRRRTPLEWTRTLVHEWGHLTLPAARGYTDPETDASGYLGERLYLKWLRDDTPPLPAAAAGETTPPASDANDGTTRAGLDLYYARQIAPLMARWNHSAQAGGGPTAPVLRDRNTRAMDTYIGAVCACDLAWGSEKTGRAVFGIAGTTAADFMESARKTWAEAFQTDTPTPVRLPAWVPLPKGTYHLTTDNGAAKNFTQTAPGWKWLDGTGTVMLNRVVKPTP